MRNIKFIIICVSVLIVSCSSDSRIDYGTELNSIIKPLRVQLNDFYSNTMDYLKDTDSLLTKDTLYVKLGVFKNTIDNCDKKLIELGAHKHGLLLFNETKSFIDTLSLFCDNEMNAIIDIIEPNISMDDYKIYQNYHKRILSFDRVYYPRILNLNRQFLNMSYIDPYIIGTWILDDSINEKEIVRFDGDGKMIYKIDIGEKFEVIRMVFETENGIIISDQPSKPKIAKTKYKIDSDTLILDHEGEISRFIRYWE